MTTQPRVLVIEDDLAIQELLRFSLVRVGLGRHGETLIETVRGIGYKLVAPKPCERE